MERTNIADLKNKFGQPVKIQGWLQTLRDQKRMQFLVVRDPTGAVQIVNEREHDPELAARISALTTESALTITGTPIENPIVKLGGLEMQLESLDVNNLAQSPLPFEPFGDTLPELDYRLDWRYMDLRRPVNALLFRIETAVVRAMREYWQKNNFVEMHSPKLMGSPSESGAELFTVEYFERKAYLSQSPQFYKQMAMAAGFERIFEIGPVFRADPSFTSRHMTEFTGVDVEFSWIESHQDVIAFHENWLRYIYQAIKDEFGPVIQEHFGKELVVPEVPFPQVTMAEAYAILKEQDYKLPPERKGDIDPGGERLLGDYIKKKYNHEYVFVTDWPISVRPFYHMRHPDKPELTRSFDLIGAGLEVTTGAQREHRYDVLARQAQEKGLGLETIQFYLDFFKYGCPSHGGFGMGLSRLLMIMLGLPNIREAVYLFRGPTRLHP
ncbi:MAG: aspartate--tRNA(Asn) ligase [Anaerolineaceae bacterium]|nr:aspartate--tRNA(Asn) ligase [Anaerolineaceae bacterium]MBN2678569.1 aspartate--tRNA(Asn) ligase [Anaerolineaceae bacterium]